MCYDNYRYITITANHKGYKLDTDRAVTYSLMYYTNTLGKDERIFILSYKMFMPDTDELVTYSQMWKKETQIDILLGVLNTF